MSELKSEKIYRQNMFGKIFTREVYDKSEADKVIAELKAQKTQAENDCAYWKTMSRKCADDNEVMAKQRAEAFKRERHQKYKRCLNKAEWCDTKADWYYSLGEHFIDCVQFYIRWRDKWLELAEKFKHNSKE